jgi:homoserine O-succinyltransferase
MPLVAHTELPTFKRLRAEGQNVLTPERATHQSIRELHVGLLNMMPDAAIEATERQFFRLVGEANPIAQFYLHPFTLDALPRGEKARNHIEAFYEPFDKIREDGLDALIITGANVTHPDLAQEAFWEPLIEVVDWASQEVTSILCSCLATHAVMQFHNGQKRTHMGEKLWGVYPHRVVDRTHPLVNDVNTLFDVPHSRFNQITREQCENAGVKVLVESEEGGVHLAVSHDGLRVVYFQGHPEYDTISLMKEYKREVMLYAAAKRKDYPPFPTNYFSLQNQAVLKEYRDRLEEAIGEGHELPEFPEKLINPTLHNTWHDTAEAVVGNWIGLVYQVTNSNRKLPFMEGIDPDKPLAFQPSD